MKIVKKLRELHHENKRLQAIVHTELERAQDQSREDAGTQTDDILK